MVCFKHESHPKPHAALRLKIAHSQRSLSEIVNDAVPVSLAKDQEDLAAFEQRSLESALSYEELLYDRNYSAPIQDLFLFYP
jgi:hypothetical protein